MHISRGRQLYGTTFFFLYMPLVNNTSISKYVYNHWTPENPSARFPRLSTETVDNNTQYASSVWLADRSF